jgi:hypothetical protein
VKRSICDFGINFTLELDYFPYISWTYISDRDFRTNNKVLGLITFARHGSFYPKSPICSFRFILVKISNRRFIGNAFLGAQDVPE